MLLVRCLVSTCNSSYLVRVTSDLGFWWTFDSMEFLLIRKPWDTKRLNLTEGHPNINRYQNRLLKWWQLDLNYIDTVYPKLPCVSSISNRFFKPVSPSTSLLSLEVFFFQIFSLTIKLNLFGGWVCWAGMVKEDFSGEDIITSRDLHGDTYSISITNRMFIYYKLYRTFLDSIFEWGNLCATPSLVNINSCMGNVVMNTYHIPCWLTSGEDI